MPGLIVVFCQRVAVCSLSWEKLVMPPAGMVPFAGPHLVKSPEQ